jgi:DNA-binding NarL/FixJ family response regulator
VVSITQDCRAESNSNLHERLPCQEFPDGADELSPREREVLKLTALGYATKKIADLMAIGGKFVETYSSRASEKLALKSRASCQRMVSIT